MAIARCLLALGLIGVAFSGLSCSNFQPVEEPPPSLGATTSADHIGKKSDAASSGKAGADDLWVGCDAFASWLLLPFSEAVGFEPILHEVDVEEGIVLLDGVPAGVDVSFEQVDETMQKLKLVGPKLATLAIPQSLLCSPPVLKAIQNLHLPRLLVDLRRPGENTAGLAECLAELSIPELHLVVRGAGDKLVEAVSTVASVVELRLVAYRGSGKALRTVAFIPRLQTLAYAGASVQEPWLAGLLAMPGLKVLDLSGSSLDASGKPAPHPASHLRAFYANRLGVANVSALTRLLDALPADSLQALELYDAPDLPGKGQEVVRFTQLRSLRLGRKALTTQLDLDFSLLPLLQDLDLYGYKATARDAAKIASLKALRTLALYGDGIQDAQVEALASLTKLESLSLSGTGVTDKSMPSVAALPELRALYLANTEVSDQGTEALAKSAKLLRRLVLEGSKITDLSGRYIGRMKSLVSLNVNGTSLTNLGSALLDDLPKLRFLHMAGTAISDNGIVPLGKLKALQVLDLAGTRVTGSGLGALAKATDLRRLVLDGCPLNDAAFQGLGQLPSLRELRLEGTALSANLLQWVSAHSSLRVLSLGHTSIDDGVLMVLARSDSLTHLSISDAQLTAEALFQLARIAPLRTLTLSPQHLAAMRDFEPLQRLKHLYAVYLRPQPDDGGEFARGLRELLPGVLVE